MNKQTVTNLIKVISKSTDKNSIYKALVKLRTDIVKDNHGVTMLLEVDGSIGALVRLISKPYEKILEVALSILGNACTVKECSKQVVDIIQALLRKCFRDVFIHRQYYTASYRLY